MSHYLDDPELTMETIVEGWLLTGDLGRLDGSGHLQLFGRKKNMIVTEGGKNIYRRILSRFLMDCRSRVCLSQPTMSAWQRSGSRAARTGLAA